LGAIQKGSAIDIAMDVLVKEIEQLLRVVGRLFSFHEVGGRSFQGEGYHTGKCENPA
jgi:hypothetical protein